MTCTLADALGLAEAAQELAATDVVALVRLFTLGEGQFSSWQAGAKVTGRVAGKGVEKATRNDAGVNRLDQGKCG